METCRQRGTTGAPAPAPAREPASEDAPGGVQGTRWAALSRADPRHPSLRAAPSGHLSNASASHPWPGRLQPRSNTGHSPMLPPLWSCDPSGSRLHFCTSVPSSENWGVITSQVTERKKQKTGRAWHLGGLRRRGRPGSSEPTPEQTRPWGAGSGCRREGGRRPRPRWKPGGARARGRCPGRGLGWVSGRGRVWPGLLGCCRRTSPGPRQLPPWRGPQRGLVGRPHSAQRKGKQPAMLSPVFT